MYRNSTSTEDYLKNIYLLQNEGDKANTSSLAKEMNISSASVSEMVSRLSAQGLIDNEPYRGFKLTEEGRSIAMNLIRKHRLIEVFLKEHLGYSWEEVHTEAERIEHSVSDEFIDKLEQYLNFPKFDPHGDPIPDKLGNVHDHHDHVLGKASEGNSYIITKVKDASIELLRYLTSIGIKLNSHIELKKKFEFDDSNLIIYEGKEYLLGKKISELIYVIEA